MFTFRKGTKIITSHRKKNGEWSPVAMSILRAEMEMQERRPFPLKTALLLGALAIGIGAYIIF